MQYITFHHTIHHIKSTPWGSGYKLCTSRYDTQHHRHHTTPHHITSHHNTSITSHHIILHHITSHRISPHQLTLQHTTIHQIPSHHITLNHIISLNVASHIITTQHLISLQMASKALPNIKNITFVGEIRAIYKWSGQSRMTIKADNSQKGKRPTRR